MSIPPTKLRSSGRRSIISFPRAKHGLDTWEVVSKSKQGGCLKKEKNRGREEETGSGIALGKEEEAKGTKLVCAVFL